MAMSSEKIRLIVISGRSGSGKSTVLNTLEDAGFNCIDNLPPALLPELVRWMTESAPHKQIAVCIDVRVSTEGLRDLPEILGSLSAKIQPGYCTSMPMKPSCYSVFLRPGVSIH